MAGNHVLLEAISLTQTTASITFDNIPQTGYTDLKIVASMRVTDGGEGTTPPISRCELTFNGTGTNYSIKMLYGIAGASPSVSSAGGDGSSRAFYCGAATSSNSTAKTFANTEYYIPKYTSSSISKSFGIKSNIENGALSSEMDVTAGVWNNSAAITSVKLNPYNLQNFAAGSTFSLYGVADVNTTPVTAPLATGGNIVANDGTYWYHAFLSSGNFVPQQELTCDMLVVAGGGGGGWYTAGGGGAGGLVYSTGDSIASGTTYSVTVGAGGTATGNSGVSGGLGNNSVFGSLYTAAGGGRGRSQLDNSGTANGGSGGGAAEGSSVSFGTSTQTSYSGKGFGNSGGSYTSGPNYGGGGGGGAGAAGSTPSGSTAGVGGAGKQYTAFANATNTGANSGYYAGGGGGVFAYSANVGAGGAGGGGAGSTTNGVAGTANTGGGGGGGAGSNGSTSYYGGAGGSGIVIIRYAMV